MRSLWRGACQAACFVGGSLPGRTPGELRGQRWRLPPEAVGAAGAPGKRKGSALADERLAKRRHEST